MLENEGVALRAIRWSEIFPWLSIAKSARLAMSLRLLAFGAAAILLTLLGWWTIAWFFSHDGSLNESWNGPFPDQSAWNVIDRTIPNRPLARWTATAPDLAKPDSMFGPVVHAWTLFSQPVLRMLSLQPSASGGPLTVSEFFALLLSALWSLAVWSYFGAAISRVAAVQLASGEQVGWAAALRWAGGKWLAYFAAPLLPMIGVGLAAIPIAVLGLLMKSDFLAVLAALVWPLALLGGLVMATLLVGVLLGWPLMWATVSVEGTDTFDALNRTYSYVYQRPLRYFCYAVVAAVVGWLGWFVVENFAAAVIWMADWAVAWGAGSARIEDIQAGGVAAWLLNFWRGWVKLLAVGYSLSYFGVASTAVYYLLRRDVDARETDEVFLDADASEERFGLPKLQKDSAGAPEIAENTPVAATSTDGKAQDAPAT